MKIAALLLVATVSLSAIADGKPKKQREKAPHPQETRSHRPAVKDGESEEARKKRLLEQLKKRRASTEHPARQTREQAERANRTERANRDRGRENAHNAERRPEGGHDRDRRADINELERKIDEAKRAGRHEEAEKLMRHFRQMREPSERGKREESEEAERRVAHLREAAELLGAIGKREESEKLRHEAAAIERRLQQHHRDRGHNEGPSNAELAKAVHGLQEQIQELHQAILEIQKHLNKKR